MKSELRQALEALRAKHGYGDFYLETRAMNKERIANARPKREKFPRATYQKLFDRQGGICACCDEQLLVPAKRNHVDHFDCQEAVTFNAFTNLRLLLPSHNLAKSSKSIEQLSKERGETTLDMINASSLNVDRLGEDGP
jgi:hypothetical protein